MKALRTPSEVVLALGGIAAVAELTARKYHAAANWPTWLKKFPLNTYRVMTDALHDRGFTAPDSLWGMQSAPRLKKGIRNGKAPKADRHRARRTEDRIK